MSHEQQIADLLDRSFGDGPGHTDVDRRLTAGRRVVRRRRSAVGASVLAVAAVVSAVALTGGSDPTRATDVATAPTTSATGTPATTPAPATGSVTVDQDGQPAGYDADGELVFRPDVEVLQRVRNPLDRAAPRTSDGLELRYEGGVHYWLLERYASGSETGISDPAGKAFGTFEEWLTDQVSEQGGAPTDELVVLTPEGFLLAGPGAEVLEQRSPVDVGPDFAPAEATTAAALVERDGVRWWVLVRRFGGQDAEYFPVSYRVGGPTMESFLDHSRAQYAGGEGLK